MAGIVDSLGPLFAPGQRAAHDLPGVVRWGVVSDILPVTDDEDTMEILYYEVAIAHTTRGGRTVTIWTESDRNWPLNSPVQYVIPNGDLRQGVFIVGAPQAGG